MPDQTPETLQSTPEHGRIPRRQTTQHLLSGSTTNQVIRSPTEPSPGISGDYRNRTRQKWWPRDTLLNQRCAILADISARVTLTTQIIHFDSAFRNTTSLKNTPENLNSRQTLE